MEDLIEQEKTFDAQFKTWESSFLKWKEQNANHPDKVCIFSENNFLLWIIANFINYFIYFYMHRRNIKSTKQNGKPFENSYCRNVSSFEKNEKPRKQKLLLQLQLLRLVLSECSKQAVYRNKPTGKSCCTLFDYFFEITDVFDSQSSFKMKKN